MMLPIKRYFLMHFMRRVTGRAIKNGRGMVMLPHSYNWANLEDSPIEMEAQELNQSSIYSESEQSEAEPSKRGYGTTVCVFIYKYGQERGFVLGADTLVTFFEDYWKSLDAVTLYSHCVTYLLASVVEGCPDITGGGECKMDKNGFIVDVSAKHFPCVAFLGYGSYCAINVFLEFGLDKGVIPRTDDVRLLTKAEFGLDKGVIPRTDDVRLLTKAGSLQECWDIRVMLNRKLQQLPVSFDTARTLVKEAITEAILTDDFSGHSIYFLYPNNFGEGYEREYRPVKPEPPKKIRRRFGKPFHIQHRRYEAEKRAELEDSKRRQKERRRRQKERRRRLRR